MINFHSEMGKQRCLNVDEEQAGLSIDCLKHGEDGCRLAVGLSNPSDPTASSCIRIYKVSDFGERHDLIRSIEYDSAVAPLGGNAAFTPSVTQITSLDWSADSEYLRFTTTDFRKIYIKRSPNTDSSGQDPKDTYEIDNYCMHELLKQQDANHLAEFWAEETCLLRWDTIGVFKPDPCQISAVEKFRDQQGEEFVIAGIRNAPGSTSEPILKIFNWPCTSPLQPSKDIKLENGAAVTKMVVRHVHAQRSSESHGGHTYAFCLMKKQASDQVVDSESQPLKDSYLAVYRIQ